VLCKQLDRPVLASAAFAGACSEALTPLGWHPLPGIGRPEQVYTLPELSSDPATAPERAG
jgi:class 3 adenylate cyclase